MNQRKKERKKERSFTLIELIIVVVIVAILALVAIPRYFTNIDKAAKNSAFASLNTIRQAELAYYAVYGAYKNTFPIQVDIDRETVINVGNFSNSEWTYAVAYWWTECNDGYGAYAARSSNTSVLYCVCMNGKPNSTRAACVYN
jgi:prepilin-type N-terminal cleavage/methylation domain-containing protein